MSEKKIRVLVVDDNDMMRRGLVETIKVEPDMEPIGAASTAEEALELYPKLKPDVVTMDYQMPGANGIECTQKIMEMDPDGKVILLSVYDTEEDIWQGVQAGVKGYITKKTGEVDIMIDAVRCVAAGETFFPAAMKRKLENRKEFRDLTPREMEVLKLLASGNSNKDICSKLDLSMTTVKFHVRHLLEKLDALDRTDVVVKALRKGIIRIDA